MCTVIFLESESALNVFAVCHSKPCRLNWMEPEKQEATERERAAENITKEIKPITHMNTHYTFKVFAMNEGK